MVVTPSLDSDRILEEETNDGLDVIYDLDNDTVTYNKETDIVNNNPNKNKNKKRIGRHVGNNSRRKFR